MMAFVMGHPSAIPPWTGWQSRGESIPSQMEDEEVGEVYKVFPAAVVKDSTGQNSVPNPAPLGLACFGLTTFLLNLHNAGLWVDFDCLPFSRSIHPSLAMILAMGLMFGGFAQIIAGILEFKRANTFGLVAFTSYGSFWIALCLIHILPKAFGVDPPSALAVAFFLFIWGVFTLFLTIGTFKAPPVHVLQIVFILLLLLFWILAIENVVKYFKAVTAAKVIQIIAGIEGTILGLLAMYLSAAETLSIHFDRVILPMSISLKKQPAAVTVEADEDIDEPILPIEEEE